MTVIPLVITTLCYLWVAYGYFSTGHYGLARGLSVPKLSCDQIGSPRSSSGGKCRIALHTRIRDSFIVFGRLLRSSMSQRSSLALSKALRCS